MGATKMLTSQRVIRGMSGFLIINIIDGLLMDNNLLMPKNGMSKTQSFPKHGRGVKSLQLGPGYVF